jgi:hypothetical protein
VDGEIALIIFASCTTSSALPTISRRTDVLRLLCTRVVEAFGYRQLTLFFRLKAFWRMLRGHRRWAAKRGRSRPISAA